MFDDIADDLIVHADIAEVLPYLSEVQSGNLVVAIDKLKELVASDNKYAAYMLGSLYLFGKTPRYYIFNKSYEVGEVKRKSLLEIQEESGFNYWVQLLKLKGAAIEDFHLEGLYDLYKVMQGSAEFFKTNDIDCRPTDENHPMYNLFKSEHKLRDFLYRQKHHEVYLDVAKDSLVEFNNSGNEESLKLAVECFQRILNGDVFNRHTQYEVSHANFEVGKLFLYGNEFIERDMRKAIAHLTESRLDVAYCELLEYYKTYGDKYIVSIRKCIGLIRDPELRAQLYKENNLQPPKAVSISDSLSRLISTQRKVVDVKDYTYDEAVVIKVPKIVDEQKALQSDAEIAASFELLDGDDDDFDSTDSNADEYTDPNETDPIHLEDEYSVDDFDMDFEIIE